MEGASVSRAGDRAGVKGKIESLKNCVLFITCKKQKMRFSAVGGHSSAHDVNKSLGEFCPVGRKNLSFSRIAVKSTTGQNSAAHPRETPGVIAEGGPGRGSESPFLPCTFFLGAAHRGLWRFCVSRLCAGFALMIDVKHQWNRYGNLAIAVATLVRQ